MKRISALVGVLGVLLLMVPSGALASSTCQSYSPQTCVSTGNTTGSTGSSPTSATNAASSGTLPFTGLDVVLLLAGGATLLGTGLVVRRMSRRLN